MTLYTYRIVVLYRVILFTFLHLERVFLLSLFRQLHFNDNELFVNSLYNLNVEIIYVR